jgi:hypothetical protein
LRNVGLGITTQQTSLCIVTAVRTAIPRFHYIFFFTSDVKKTRFSREIVLTLVKGKIDEGVSLKTSSLLTNGFSVRLIA